MPYHISPLPQEPNITVVGCGGTGGFVAESLCRLFTGRKAAIILVDHDRVERHNILRQNFQAQDIGKFKSQVLAERLSFIYDRPIGYSIHPLIPNKSMQPGIASYQRSLIIGCVDNAKARLAMSQCLEGQTDRWLIDAGNGQDWGQVLIGNTIRPDALKGSLQNGQCQALPAPTVQRPDLLTTVPATLPDIDCAAALDLTDQDPVINQMMAKIVVMIVRRMAAGTCPWTGLHLDMDHGTLSPNFITPEAVSRMSGISVEELCSPKPTTSVYNDDPEDDDPDDDDPQDHPEDEPTGENEDFA